MVSGRIIYLQYTNPAAYPPLEHSSRLLASEGWQVLFLGVRGDGEVKVLRFPAHPSLMVRQLPSCSAGWRQKIHYLWFCVWVIGWTLRWRSRWVYASNPLSCPVGLLLSLTPGLRVIYHEHDSPDPVVNPPSTFMRFVLWARKRLARRADFCILPNQDRARRFASKVGGREVLCVWNCPRKEEVTPFRLPSSGKGVRILYHGSLVPQRLPPAVIHALTEVSETVTLRLIGYETIGHIGYQKQLQTLARQLGLGHRLEVLGPLPTRWEVLEASLECDVGLSLMPLRSKDLNLQHMVGASNKPFDYLACGLALLVSDLPAWKRMYVEPGCGLACNPDDPRSIAEALRWFLEHPLETRAMGERGRQRILEEWNYERQFLPALERLKAGDAS